MARGRERGRSEVVLHLDLVFCMYIHRVVFREFVFLIQYLEKMPVFQGLNYTYHILFRVCLFDTVLGKKNACIPRIELYITHIIYVEAADHRIE